MSVYVYVFVYVYVLTACQKDHPCHLSNTDLEPINGTAVDERWELSESVSEGITDGAHSEDNVKLISDSRYEEVKQSYE